MRCRRYVDGVNPERQVGCRAPDITGYSLAGTGIIGAANSGRVIGKPDRAIFSASLQPLDVSGMC